MIKGFRHVCVVVSDLGRSLRFYRDIMGLKVSKVLTIEGEGPETVLGVKGIKLTYVKMRSPDQPEESPPVFELHYWENPRISCESGYNHISFTVTAIEKENDRLSQAGVKFISRPINVSYSKAKLCFCYDPDNHLIELVEEEKEA